MLKILITLRNKLLGYKRENKVSENLNESNLSKLNIREDIIDVKFEDNLVVIDIKDSCSFMDYSYTIDKCYSKLNDTFIPIKIFITNGGNIFNWILFKQKVYIFKHNSYDYMISISDEKIRISQTILKDDLYYETELDYNVLEKQFIVYKLIHDLNHSTKCPKWYPEEKNSSFYLDKEEAKEMLVSLFNDLDEINNIDNIINNLSDIKNNVFREFDVGLILKKRTCN